ncbi:MAG: HEAT repeat domain-containing protein [Planctomycetes bacterium]|nr:HEAT repeat domain-containing protein [Planctomycetota bacterium]
MRRAVLLLVASLLLFATGPASAGDPALDLKSDDVQVRVAAVESLRTGDAPDAEALLLIATKDRDWEVVEKAVVALGDKGGAACVKPLVQIALEAPAHRIRKAAARALARNVQHDVAVDALLSRTGGELAHDAFEALAEMARTFEMDPFEKGLEKGLDAKPETGVRGAAAGLVSGLKSEAMAARLPKLLSDKDAEVGCAAADAARVRGSALLAPPLIAYLSGEKTSAVVERRVRRALVTIARVAKDTVIADAVAKTLKADPPSSPPLTTSAAARLARFVGDLIEGPEPVVAAARSVEILGPALDHADPKVRAAAVHSLGRMRSDETAAKSRTLARQDSDARVRLIAQRSAVKTGDPSKQPTLGMLLDALEYDADPLVREEAAVALGRPGLTDASLALAKAADRAMADKDGSEWAAGTCALVSLGKTGDPGAIPTLLKVLDKAKDWRLRGAALVGLGHVRQKAAIPVLIDALANKDPNLRAVAFEFLRRFTSESIVARQDLWKAWWKKAEPSFGFRDFAEEAEKAKKYGYSPTFEGVYEGLDVIVLQSRGDHIEQLLERLAITHRITHSGAVPDAGLHPFGIFVANCTGEITPKDVEPLQWFVRVGGYMFASCWALHHTVEKVYPGVVRRWPLKGQVIDTVEAHACRDASPFLEGVFTNGGTPMYVLEGAYLIEVLDQERSEVLIDSPWTEAKYGAGDLAAWFSAGHGVILDSVNHFDLQGFDRAEGLKTAADRKAYALDHLGMTYDEIRKISDATWDNGTKAGKEAKDLSAFRFITNFVREKRKWFE